MINNSRGGSRILDVSWTNWKTCAARAEIETYYVSRASTYTAIAIDYRFVYQCTLDNTTDIEDFETNYKSGAAATTSTFDAIAYAFRAEVLASIAVDTYHNTLSVRKGAAVSGTQSGMMIGGFDGTNAQLLRTSSDGSLQVDLNDGSGNALTSTGNSLDTNIKSQANALKVSKSTSDNAANNPIYTQLSDGTSAVTATSGALDINIKSVTGTNLKADIAAQSLTALAISKNNSANAVNNPIDVRMTDGSAALGTTSNPVYVNNKDGSGNALTSTSSALDTNIKSQTNALKVSKSTADNAANNPIHTQLTDGSAAVGTTGNPLFVNNKDGSGNALTSTSSALDTNIKSQTNALKISKSTSDNAVGNPIFVQMSDGSLAIGTTGNPVFTNTKDGSGNAISSTAPGSSGVRSLDVAQRAAPIADSNESVWDYGETTTNSTSSNQTITSYTVPSGKSFYIIAWYADNINETSVSPRPYRLRVDSTDKASSIPSDKSWVVEMPVGVKIADAGDVVRVTVSPSSGTSTTWAARIIGVIK